jgi:hypothetical protein
MARQPWAVVVVGATVVALVLMWVASGVWQTTAGQESPGVPCEAGEPRARSVALGAYVDGAPEDPAKIDGFASMVGEQPAVVMWYQDWFTPGVKEFDPVRMDEVLARGAMPMVTWEPADWTRGADQPDYQLRDILDGNHDPYVRQFAQDSKDYGKPFYLRFAHEMNGHWYPWSPLANGNGGAEEYVAAWRHVHGIFEQEGATNVRWVWNPDLSDSDRSTPNRPSYASLYPGDGYVDWVAIDAYNWGASQPQWSSWQTFPEMFEASYEEMDALTDKPMMVGETGSAESGGDKAAWIRRTFLADIPSRYPRVRAVIWFHENKETDWRVNSSEGSLEAYREVAASPLYRGRLPASGRLEADTDIVSGPPQFTNSAGGTFESSSSARARLC